MRSTSSRRPGGVRRGEEVPSADRQALSVTRGRHPATDLSVLRSRDRLAAAGAPSPRSEGQLPARGRKGSDRVWLTGAVRARHGAGQWVAVMGSAGRYWRSWLVLLVDDLDIVATGSTSHLGFPAWSGRLPL